MTDSSRDRRPGLVQACGLLRGPRPLVPGPLRRRRRRPARAARTGWTTSMARRRLPLAAAVLPVAAARRRLRRRRPDRRRTRHRHHRGLQRAARRDPRPRDADDHRLGDEPHLGPAPLVPGSHAPTRTGRTATSTSGPTPTSSYRDARIIFVDTEASNWTWDPVRQQYFWHRFYSHQPDLNFDNPAVHDAILDVPRLLAGPRRRRLPPRRRALPVRARGDERREPPGDARLPAHGPRFVDESYPGRVLLAEANQWPADVVDYFGDFASGGDECHMCFHFPLMPRIFMAVRRESRYPISEILEQTPPIPEHCQWGIFLRNHDELTLEMVTDEDRDYMWAEYAHRPADEGEHRDPAPARPAAGQRREPDGAVHRAAAEPARIAGALLRRRDRHGRQHLARRPRRRTHPDAVDAGPQRRLLHRHPGSARRCP